MGERLEGDLVLDRDVVAEHHDMQAALQRAARLAAGELAGHRDDREIGAGHMGDG